MNCERVLIDAIERLEADALRRWIDLGWVLPDQDSDSLRFDPSYMARVHTVILGVFWLRVGST